MAAFPQCDAPDIIPGYTCAECIGAGGYGEVWKVNAPGGLTKALKIIYGFIGEEVPTESERRWTASRISVILTCCPWNAWRWSTTGC